MTNETWEEAGKEISKKSRDTVMLVFSIVLDAVLLVIWLVSERYAIDGVKEHFFPEGSHPKPWALPAVELILNLSFIVPLGVFFIRDSLVVVIQAVKSVTREWRS